MEQIYRIPGGLFCAGAPVFVKEATMHQQEDKLFAKLVMENKDAAKKICAVTVRLSPIAANGAVIGDGEICRYENLQAEPGSDFGAEVYNALPQGSCAFGAAVLQVTFADGSQWEAESKLAWHVQ